MFVWLSFTQTLAAFIAGCEAAWVFFGGVFKVLVPDNASAIVADADAVNPRFTAGWLDYAQHCGFATDAARVRSPKDKPRVERAVQYVRGNFFAGEAFTGLSDAQARAEAWCRDVAGMRIHGTIAARPAEVFAEHEAAALLPLSLPYDVPVFTRVKVHRDFHVEIGRALYSAPKEYLGCHLDARADSALVKLFHRGQLVKAHPRQQPGRRVTDPADLPAEKTTYAMRDVASLAAAARRHGDAVGVYAERLLDTDLPWTKMRQVYRLLGLVRRYGPGPVDTACARALDLDVVSVTKIASMLEKATENTPLPPRPARRRGRPVRPRPGRVPARAADAHPRREGGQASDRDHARCGQPGPAHHAAGAQARPDARHPARPAHPGPAAENGPRRLPRARPGRRGRPAARPSPPDCAPGPPASTPGCGWTPGTSPPRSATTGSCGTSSPRCGSSTARTAP